MKKLIKQVPLVQRYLFYFAFLAISVTADMVILPTAQVWDDLVGYLLAVNLGTGILGLLMCWGLFVEKKPVHKILGVVFALVAALFIYLGIVDALEVLIV